MSERLRQIAARLDKIAKALGEPDADDERAQELAREAGELAAEAGTEADRALREASPDE
ncbi:MAG TPA: hypothetical protein VEK39_00615 [Solirubrobacterales bacterium]|nr:hypothetical protein [Solirubrobacterales bacterium]